MENCDLGLGLVRWACSLVGRFLNGADGPGTPALGHHNQGKCFCISDLGEHSTGSQLSLW